MREPDWTIRQLDDGTFLVEYLPQGKLWSFKTADQALGLIQHAYKRWKTANDEVNVIDELLGLEAYST